MNWGWWAEEYVINWDTHFRDSLWLGNDLLWFVLTTSLLSSLSLFSQCESCFCSSISLKISSITSSGVECTSSCTMRSVSSLSISSTDAMSFWTSSGRQHVAWFSPVSYSQSSFLSCRLLNPSRRKHFTIVCFEICSQALLNHWTSCNTDTDC
jgi:hypothetical protein